jgi:hypothetical protein
MKRLVFILFTGILMSCNDGDLQIESINFDDISIQTCESTITLSSTVFFKLNAEEALILELQSGLLKNEASQETIISALPGESNLIYRLFTGTVATDYFCNAIPPITPTVLEEIEASVGEVLITTIQSPSDSTQFEHTIELRNITLINQQGDRITDTSISNFGTITTSL